MSSIGTERAARDGPLPLADSVILHVTGSRRSAYSRRGADAALCLRRRT